MCGDNWSKLYIIGGYNTDGYIASELVEVEVINVENKNQVD